MRYETRMVLAIKHQENLDKARRLKWLLETLAVADSEIENEAMTEEEREEYECEAEELQYDLKCTRAYDWYMAVAKAEQYPYDRRREE